MLGFLLRAQRPPKPKAVKEGVVMRMDHVYEVDPAKMQVFKQQDMPVWDTLRIVKNRWEHLAWMHNHFADSVVSGEELEREIKKGKKKNPSKGRVPKRKKK
jgi:hypothetical protein